MKWAELTEGEQRELDALVADYKRRADADENISASDLRWLVNEVIYERDHQSTIEGQPDWAPVRALVEQWRSSADWMMGSTQPDEWQKGGSGYLRKCAEELEALLPLLPRSEMDWQPIETAPKDGTKILLWNGYRRALGWWAGFERGNNVNPFMRQCLLSEPLGRRDSDPDTHWMPLPDPPKETVMTADDGHPTVRREP